MEEVPQAPKSKKATIEWLRAQLDAKQLQLLSCQKKNEELYGYLEDRSDEVYSLKAQLRDRTRELAEARAYNEIGSEESEALRKELHHIYTRWQLKQLGVES